MGRSRATMYVEESVEIGRPVEEVFAYAADPENLPEWSGLAIEVRKDTSGPLREGDVFVTVAKFLGRRFETPFEVTSYETNRRYTHRATGGPIPDQEWTYTYEEVPGGHASRGRGRASQGASSSQPTRSSKEHSSARLEPIWRRSRTFSRREARRSTLLWRGRGLRAGL
jgi:uncharacterized protein YndB with AHSA1/START domain